MKRKLLAKLKSNIIHVTKRDDDIIYATLKTNDALGYKYRVSEQPVHDDDSISMYDLVRKQYVKMQLDDIASWGVSGIDYVEWIQSLLDVASEVAANTDYSEQDIRHKLCHAGITNMVDVNVVRYFDFIITCPEDLTFLEQQDMTVFYDWYMAKIRARREECFLELDDLEADARKEGCEEDDLVDIDVIKQMFRDIPQDVDLTQYKTVSELIDFWPSLLMPRAKIKDFGVMEQLLIKGMCEQPADDLKELTRILGSIESREYLTAFKNELDPSTTPSEYIQMIDTRIGTLR